MTFDALPVASTLHLTALGLVPSVRLATTAPFTVNFPLPPGPAGGVAAEGAVAVGAAADVAVAGVLDGACVLADAGVAADEGDVDPPVVDAGLLELEQPAMASTVAAAAIATRRRGVGEVMTDSGGRRVKRVRARRRE